MSRLDPQDIPQKGSMGIMGPVYLPTLRIRGPPIHRENGGTLGMVPLIINPIYTLYSGYLLGISPLKGLQQGG